MSDIKRVDFHLTDGMPRGSVYETADIQIMRIRLSENESVPHHNSNTNVLLVPLAGSIQLATVEGHEVIGVGEALSVPYNTPMDVKNAGNEMAIFLVLKTPHPNKYKQAE